MIRTTTTRATYRGVQIMVLADSSGHGTTYSCTNNSGRPKVLEAWFTTQAEAIANEKREIDSITR